MADSPEMHEHPAKYGPYHRLSSPTQTFETALEQRRSGELWGKMPRGGLAPEVEAYRGPLPNGSDGIEFYTDVVPTSSRGRVRVSWLASSNDGTQDEFAIIPCVVVRIVENGRTR